MTITAAIVAALCAVTILVFAGGKDEPAPAPAANPPVSACQTGGGIDCVEAAKDIVEGSSAPTPTDPAGAGLP